MRFLHLPVERRIFRPESRFILAPLLSPQEGTKQKTAPRANAPRRFCERDRIEDRMKLQVRKHPATRRTHTPPQAPLEEAKP